MSERSELRRRREERMKNGVKNLKGARLFPKTFSNHGYGDASWGYLHIPFLEWAVRKRSPFFEFPY
jgi:hypothetical protein